MTRLPVLRHDQLDNAQREVWEQITGGRRAAAHSGTGGLVDAEGGLIGPFNAWLTSPTIGGAAARLGEAARFGSVLDRGVVELVIVVVAVHWRAEFEFWAHRRYALEAGVPAELIDSIASGGVLVGDTDSDRLLVESCQEILATGRLGSDRYAGLAAAFGEPGVVDIVTIVGYYSLVSFNLNVFEILAPPDVGPVWPEASSKQ